MADTTLRVGHGPTELVAEEAPGLPLGATDDDRTAIPEYPPRKQLPLALGALWAFFTPDLAEF